MDRRERDTRARAIRCQAVGLLVSLGIPQLLGAFGTWRCTGSFALDVMTWNDLDLYLVIPDGHDPWGVLETILRSLAGAKGFIEGRLLRFQGDAKRPMPRGTYLGLRFHPPGWNCTWKVDLWVLGTEDLENHRAQAEALRRRLTPERRDLILEVKHALMAGQDRVPQTASHWVYQSVLLRGLDAWEDLQRDLSDVGIHLAPRSLSEPCP